MNNKAEQLTLTGLVFGFLIVIAFLMFLIYGLSNATDSTSTAIKQGSSMVIGILILFLVIIGILVLFIIFLKRYNS
jgi:hypothetical protein